MHHCLLTESLPQWPYLKITHRQLSSVRAQCGADQQPCRGSTSRYLTDSFLLIGRAERCTVQLLGKNCFLVTGCGVIWQRNGFLLMAVLVLLCSIRIRWVQCALNFFFFKFYFIFKLYNIVLVLPNIKMNPPQVYPCSPS